MGKEANGHIKSVKTLNFLRSRNKLVHEPIIDVSPGHERHKSFNYGVQNETRLKSTKFKFIF